MRKALVVGIDHYRWLSPLQGCVHDAQSIANVLEANEDGTWNFDVRPFLATERQSAITREDLKRNVKELFACHKGDTALFYYAGHGSLTDTGGYLVTSECKSGGEGLPLGDVLAFAYASQAESKIIILDSCNAGAAGARITQRDNSELADGMVILAATTDRQVAEEEDGAGIFTTLLVDALEGAAANLVGNVSPGSAYAHIDQSLDSWGQRPVFKANVQSFVTLRKAKPPIDGDHLRQLTMHFPEPDYPFQLDPSFEPTSPQAKPENTARFAILQKYNRVNLVVPTDAEHMYFAAMESKSCRLTALGRHYWRLVKSKRLGRPAA